MFKHQQFCYYVGISNLLIDVLMSNVQVIKWVKQSVLMVNVAAV